MNQSDEIDGRSVACACDFDKAFHADLNARRGKGGDRCTNRVRPEDMGWNGSPAYCTPCLFGCAP